MGTLFATIFTVIAIAISSVFVSNQLSTKQGITPNAPSSTPLADTGTCDESSITASVCHGKKVGEVVFGCYKCTRTSGTYCSAINICTTPVQTPTITQTPTPACASTNKSCNSSAVKPCCSSNDVCKSVYGGYFCVTKSKECTSGTTKCQKESSKYYLYTCDSDGYYQKTKVCDAGCSADEKSCSGSSNNNTKTCTIRSCSGVTCSSSKKPSTPATSAPLQTVSLILTVKKSPLLKFPPLSLPPKTPLPPPQPLRSVFVPVVVPPADAGRVRVVPTSVT